MKKGKIILLSGPSGSGKGTIVNKFKEEYKDKIYLSVSATTRSPREGEIDGVSYYFISKEDFKQRIKEKRMLEYAEFCGNFYGTPAEPVLASLEEGKNAILEIEVQGAYQVKENYPEARMIFVVPPSGAVLRDRLVGRGTETAEVINKRLFTATSEIEKAFNYDYILVNDDLNEAVKELAEVIDSDINNISQKKDFLEGVIEDVKALSK